MNIVAMSLLILSLLCSFVYACLLHCYFVLVSLIFYMSYHPWLSSSFLSPYPFTYLFLDSLHSRNVIILKISLHCVSGQTPRTLEHPNILVSIILFRWLDYLSYLTIPSPSFVSTILRKVSFPCPFPFSKVTLQCFTNPIFLSFM
jgi:hypothetical protein